VIQIPVHRCVAASICTTISEIFECSQARRTISVMAVCGCRTDTRLVIKNSTVQAQAIGNDRMFLWIEQSNQCSVFGETRPRNLGLTSTKVVVSILI